VSSPSHGLQRSYNFAICLEAASDVVTVTAIMTNVCIVCSLLLSSWYVSSSSL
jgi:hypothetical protein